jgi:hypothetical protein
MHRDRVAGLGALDVEGTVCGLSCPGGITFDGKSLAVLTKPSKQSSVHETMRVPEVIRCFGAAPPNVYTRSPCSGAQRSVGAAGGISRKSGAGVDATARLEPAAGAAAVGAVPRPRD